jgi:F-type H+-transporting ATPase subunit b
MNSLTTFAAEQAGGISALGLNVQSFVFQLITFVAVLWLLRKFVYGRLVDTLEARRKAVEDSLDKATAAAKELEETEAKVGKMLDEARTEAADIVALAHKEATTMVEEAEAKAAKKAEHMVAQAEARLKQDIEAARVELRHETASLVAAATEKVLKQKVDSKADKDLIASALKEASK